MPFSSQARARQTICNDQVIGAILSGWRYDISAIPKDLRSDYEDHLRGCEHCRRRQRLHRTVDVLLLAATTLSFAAFLLAAIVLHKLDSYSHLYALHVHLHDEGISELRRFPDSITIGLETVACVGVFISMLLWVLVAIATPVPSMLTSIFRRNPPADHDPLHKQAA